jgi:hypothetical protein
VLRVKERAPIFFPFCCLHLWIRNWVHQGAWGCLNWFYNRKGHIWLTTTKLYRTSQKWHLVVKDMTWHMSSNSHNEHWWNHSCHIGSTCHESLLLMWKTHGNKLLRGGCPYGNPFKQVNYTCHVINDSYMIHIWLTYYTHGW